MTLIVGGDSFVGRATADYLEQQEVAVVRTTRRGSGVGARIIYLDLARRLEGWEPPPGVRGACICAGAARLSECADDPTATAWINVHQTLELVDLLVRREIFVVFLSTNQVFDGSRAHIPPGTPHSPVSEYGRQKAAAERRLMREIDNAAPVAILRLTKVVARNMPLIEQWRTSLRARRTISAFSDMQLAPVPVDVVAQSIGALLSAREPGIYQLSGPEDVSYLDLARLLAQRVGAEAWLVTETTATQAGLPVGATPSHTTLDSSTLEALHGIVVPAVDELVASRFV